MIREVLVKRGALPMPLTAIRWDGLVLLGTLPARVAEGDVDGDALLLQVEASEEAWDRFAYRQDRWPMEVSAGVSVAAADYGRLVELLPVPPVPYEEAKT